MDDNTAPGQKAEAQKRDAEAGCVSFRTVCSSLVPCSLESWFFLATFMNRHLYKVIHGSLVCKGKCLVWLHSNGFAVQLKSRPGL